MSSELTRTWEWREKYNYYWRHHRKKTGTVAGLDAAVKKIAWMEKVPLGYLE